MQLIAGAPSDRDSGARLSPATPKQVSSRSRRCVQRTAAEELSTHRHPPPADCPSAVVAATGPRQLSAQPRHCMLGALRQRSRPPPCAPPLQADTAPTSCSAAAAAFLASFSLSHLCRKRRTRADHVSEPANRSPINDPPERAINQALSLKERGTWYLFVWKICHSARDGEDKVRKRDTARQVSSVPSVQPGPPAHGDELSAGIGDGHNSPPMQQQRGSRICVKRERRA